MSLFTLVLGTVFLLVYVVPSVRDKVLGLFGLQYNPMLDLVAIMGASWCLSATLGLVGILVTLGAVILRMQQRGY